MGFMKKFADGYKTATGGAPIDPAELREDLRACVAKVAPDDQNSLLGPLNSWGDILDVVPESEGFLAVAPAVAKGRGFLAVTGSRLFYGGQAGSIEFPLSELSTSRVGTDSIGTLRIDRDHDFFEFGMSPYKRETREQFMSVLMAAIRSAATPSTSAPASSTADELAKLASLRDQGILTDAEFDRQKQQLLGA